VEAFVIWDKLNSTTYVSRVEAFVIWDKLNSTEDVSRMEDVVTGDILNSYNRRQRVEAAVIRTYILNNSRALPNCTIYVKVKALCTVL
jgi:hypothetical protein